MFVYEKKLQYPVKIRRPNARLAKFIASQYGGAYGKSLGILACPKDVINTFFCIGTLAVNSNFL